MTDVTQLVEVRILQLPMDVYRESTEHTDDLLREFALIREQDSGTERDVPDRLLTLIDKLQTQFGGFTAEPDSQLQAALARGDKSIDLIYRVPHEARDASRELEDLLDQADDFCRAGTELLTLATPRKAVVFRRWFLDEFIRQIDGEAPRPWPEVGGTTS